jgi:hypothetical protein
MDTVTFLFVFGKYFLIMDYLDLKDSSHKLQINYIINYFLFIFNISYMYRKIRCDGKFYNFF